jgi:osmotically-inducible protein OsmY
MPAMEWRSRSNLHMSKRRSGGFCMTIVRKYLFWIMVAVFLGTATGCAPTPERRGTGEVVDDAGLTARVKTAIAKAEGITGAAQINVNSYRGEVQLSGFLENEDMIRRAGEAARTVSGVTRVRNDLRVAPRK